MAAQKSPVPYTGTKPHCTTCGAEMVLRGRAGLFRCPVDGRHPITPIETTDPDLKELIDGRD